MRSLALKLTLAFLLVGITGTLLVSLFVGRRTQQEFDQFVLDRYRSDLVSELANYYANNGGWQNIAALVAPNPSGHWRPERFPRTALTLLDKDRMVLYSQRYRRGEPLPRPEAGRGVPILVEGETVGWLLFDPPALPNRPLSDSPEAAFLARMRQALRYGALGAVVVALLLGIVLARTLTRPLRELTAATRALAQGALGEQVPVRSTDELGELAASFNQMSTDLARAVETRRQMTADVAHDLRTPLSVILGYTEALADDKIPGSRQVYQVMHGEAQHLQHLIEDLRVLSLADAGELSLNCQPTSPRSLLARTAAAHLPLAQARGIDLRVDAPADLPAVKVDPERMAQVLGNLVGNALRYTENGGHVDLSATSDGTHVSLQVQDTGEGIAPEDLPHIFDRFYRADAARAQQEEESGLGLAIARSIVEAHGGTISAASRPGHGTTFTIDLAAVAD